MSYFSDLDKLWGTEGSTPPRPPKSKKKHSPIQKGAIIFGAVMFLFIIAAIGKGIFTEWLWFDSLGFSSIYSTVLTTKLWLFAAGAIIFLILLLSNLFLARRLSPPRDDNVFSGQGLIIVRRVLDTSVLISAIFLSLIFGLVTSGKWEMVLRFTNGTNFNVTEPLLGRDIVPSPSEVTSRYWALSSSSSSP